MELEDGSDSKVCQESSIEYVRVNGEKYIKEKGFGKMTKRLRFEETNDNQIDAQEITERGSRR